MWPNELGVKTGEIATVKGEDYEVDVKTTGVVRLNSLQRTHQIVVCNIAQLFQVAPIFASEEVNKKLATIKQTDASLVEALNNNMIGAGKRYQLADGTIRYCFGNGNFEAGEVTRLSANPMPADVKSFSPIDDQLSRDDSHIYREYYSVTKKRDGGLLKRKENTNFRKYNDDLYRSQRAVTDRYGNQLSLESRDGIETIHGYVTRINGPKPIILCGHAEAKGIAYPEKLQHSAGRFFFDGTNIYLANGVGSMHNITDLYKLSPGQNISLLEPGAEEDAGIYQIGSDVQLVYDGALDIKISKIE